MSNTEPLAGFSAPDMQGRQSVDSLAEMMQRCVALVRQHPSSARERWLLFELLCVSGDWERAKQQLQTWSRLNPDGTPRAQAYLKLVHSEALRAAVFAGTRSPDTLTKLPAWVETLLQANGALAQGDLDLSDRQRSEAFSEAPLTRGECSKAGQFEWIADSDTRLGPILELTAAEGYGWVAFGDIQSLTFGPVGTLLDLIWRPVAATLRSGTTLRGYTPIRYPESEHGSDAHKLSRETTWRDVGETGVIALGQKTWSTDKGDLGVLDVNECRFDLP